MQLKQHEKSFFSELHNTIIYKYDNYTIWENKII